MGVRTRSVTSSPVKVAPAKAVTIDQSDPLKVFILPRDVSSAARFLLLNHPRHRKKTRFYFCPTKGLFEFTKITAPSGDPRSILFTAAHQGDSKAQKDPSRDKENEQASFQKAGVSQGHVNKAAEFLVATPFDLGFMLLQVHSTTKNTSGKALFQPLDDILEQYLAEDKHFRYIFHHGRAMLEDAMERICDTIDAGDEKMYRLNESKLLRTLLDKAERAVAKGLPPSLEERFVTRALESPVLSIKREKSSTTDTVEKTCEENVDSLAESFESQSTSASNTGSAVFSETSSTITTSTVMEDIVPSEICRLQRVKIAMNFITSSYIPKSIGDRLLVMLESEESPVVFKPLEVHLKELATVRAEALVLRSLTDFSRKRGNIDDDEAAEARAEKKRKLDEEEKRKKAGESRGVRDLKKVNVSGMKKMSDFFTKKPVSAKNKA